MKSTIKHYKKSEEKSHVSGQNKEDVSRFLNEGNPNTEKKIDDVKTKTKNKNQKFQSNQQLDEDEGIDLSTDVPSNDEEAD